MSTNKTLITIGLLVLLALIAGYYFMSRQAGTDQLFQEHFEPYPNIISSMERSSGETSSEVDEIMNEYEAENYKKALRQFNKYLRNHPDKNQVKLYRGITHLKLGNIDKAIDDFEQVAVADNKLGAQATWYLGLSYLKKGNQDQASVYFQSLMKDNTQYAMDAEEILDKLGNAMAVGNDRLYEITDDGNYRFTYWQDNEPDPHPITERTFYLEAKELAILPEDISYLEFKRLSTDEQQTLLTHGQKDLIAQMKDNMDEEKLQKAEEEAQNIIADMRKKEETNALAKSESPSFDQEEPNARTEKVKTAENEEVEITASADKANKQPKRNKEIKRKKSDLHWMVKSLTDASHGTALPEKTGRGTNTPVNKTTDKSKTASSSRDGSKKAEEDNEQKKKESPLPSKSDLPWVIDAMTNTDAISGEPSFNTEKDQNNDVEKEMTELVQLMTEPSK